MHVRHACTAYPQLFLNTACPAYAGDDKIGEINTDIFSAIRKNIIVYWRIPNSFNKGFMFFKTS
jgi:hypothetical protein